MKKAAVSKILISLAAVITVAVLALISTTYLKINNIDIAALLDNVQAEPTETVEDTADEIEDIADDGEELDVVNVEVVEAGIYSEVRTYGDDLLCVQDVESALWGYIDRSGEYVIEPVYIDAYGFSEGLAPVQNMEGKFLFIDTEGKDVFNKVFDAVHRKYDIFMRYNYYTATDYTGYGFADGSALVESDGEKYYIDKNGEKIKTFTNTDGFFKYYYDGKSYFKRRDYKGFSPIDSTNNYLVMDYDEFDNYSEMDEYIYICDYSHRYTPFNHTDDGEYYVLNDKGEIIFTTLFVQDFAWYEMGRCNYYMYFYDDIISIVRLDRSDYKVLGTTIIDYECYIVDEFDCAVIPINSNLYCMILDKYQHQFINSSGNIIVDKSENMHIPDFALDEDNETFSQIMERGCVLLANYFGENDKFLSISTETNEVYTPTLIYDDFYVNFNDEVHQSIGNILEYGGYKGGVSRTYHHFDETFDYEGNLIYEASSPYRYENGLFLKNDVIVYKVYEGYQVVFFD